MKEEINLFEEKIIGNLEERLHKKWEVRKGDIFCISSTHYIMCGDSTNPQNVETLLRNKSIDMVVTSPPYLDLRDYNIENFDWNELLISSFQNLYSRMDVNCDILVNLGLVYRDKKVCRYWDTWIDYMEQNNRSLFGWYIWDKGNGMPGNHNGRLAPAHEFIFHFRRNDATPTPANKWIETKWKHPWGRDTKRNKDGSLTLRSPSLTDGQDYKVPDSVIRISREWLHGLQQDIHPATYPLDFAYFLIKTWMKDPNTVVYDPFLGSGTTILATAKAECRGIGMEIDPTYVAVSLERLEQKGLTVTKV